MGKKTPLFEKHESLGAKMADFSGWDMPIHYGSQIEEHHAVRQGAGVFDVSHMTVVELHGTDGMAYLDRLLANDIGRVKNSGQAMYSAMLSETGGVLDDLIVYATGDPYLVVVNCATRGKDLAWMRQVAEGYECEVVERTEFAILAIQGPCAIEKVKSVVGEEKVALIEGLKVFQGGWCDGWFIARTGYTGEQGVEIILPEDQAVSFWDSLLEAGIRPIGLGARDTLRLEAGMNLYGNDMDESVTPLESYMANTVVLEGRDFIGADALRKQTEHDELVGLVMLGKGILRAHYPVFSNDAPVGEITSGAFSPTLGKSIALARVSATSSNMTVGIRGKMQAVECVNPPFVRNGKQVYKLRKT
ncbi:MAG: glycine cleavage system aminomethyltransferase GcvT [Gammaproteobacteria bacterium]|jgi:aminomethyltransferase|nr:glycine cleavage system aminomethyltransferase GcvT [Gammaproteobacteria bacterium]